MARIVPDGWEALDYNGAAQREIETLRRLVALPDDCTVLHGVHWTRIEHGCSVYGDIDFIVVAPNGRILLIEQKSGFLEETPDGLVKAQGTSRRRVATHILRSIAALETRFAQTRPGRPTSPTTTLSLDYLLYCPDHRVRDTARAGIVAERIVDASRAAELVAVIVDLLTPTTAAGSADAATALRFFSDELVLVADVATLVGRTDRWVTRLSGGLAQAATQLEFTPFRLRVRGTAGSGKTQLALKVLRDAADAGQRALYLCYNRPLADHIGTIAPDTAVVANFHAFGDRLLRAADAAPDFGTADSFRRLEAAVIDARPTEADRFDVVIVDEGQDFTPAWRDAALRFVGAEGRAYWLEDPLQNLYGREPVALDGWVTLHATVNYRSPRDIIDAIVPVLARGSGAAGNAHDGDALLAISTASPLTASDLEVATWHDDAGGRHDGEAATRALLDVTMRAITRALAAGFRRQDIVLLTFAGRDHSALLAAQVNGSPALGPHALRVFAGSYDLFGKPVYTAGEVLAETIYRFKGQSAPCVIFTEIDFEVLDERTVRKLFVGATRATHKLMLVMSERAARVCRVDGAGAQ